MWNIEWGYAQNILGLCGIIYLVICSGKKNKYSCQCCDAVSWEANASGPHTPD